jgi:hypothetical protein
VDEHIGWFEVSVDDLVELEHVGHQKQLHRNTYNLDFREYSLELKQIVEGAKWVVVHQQEYSFFIFENLCKLRHISALI